jgi:hypothetical protein
MNFLEQWLNITPDGGSGVLEILYIGAAVAALSAVAFRRKLASLLRNARRSSTIAESYRAQEQG